MTEQNECIIERSMKCAGIDHSLHDGPHDGTDHLKINSHLLTAGEQSIFRNSVRILTGGEIQNGGFSETHVEKICEWCHLCTPIHFSSENHDSIQIVREGYKPREETSGQHELYTAAVYEPKASGRLDTHRICMLDDDDDFIYYNALRLQHFGATVLGIRVHSFVKPTEEQSNILFKRITRFDPTVVVTDLGLGHVHALKLIDSLKRLGIPTVILAGASSTDETRRHADVYLVKAIDPDDVIDGMMRAIEINRQT